MQFRLCGALPVLLLVPACTTVAPRPAGDVPSAERRGTPLPADLDRRLDTIAERAVSDLTGKNAVPQLAPEPPEGGRPAGLQEVTIRAEDGLALRAWLVPPERAPARATVLVLPGWGSNVEFALEETRFLLAGGYRLLLLDPRANLFLGRAADFRGFLEEDLRDIGAALAWLRGRDDVDPSRLAVYGFSWGGLKAVLAARRHPELRAIVDDAGPDVPYEFMGPFMEFTPPSVRADEAVRRSYLDRVDSLMRRELGYGFDAVDAERAAAGLSPRPLLVITSDDDAFVPPSIPERIFAAAGEPKQFLRGRDFGHCLGMRRNPAVYLPAVSKFLGSAFPEPPAASSR